jgi:CBS domain-containing protein
MNASDAGAGGAQTGRMSDAPTVSRETFVKDFRERMKDRLPDETIDAAAETMTAATTSYLALMIPISVIFYSRVQVLINDSKAPSSPQFGGNAGGVVLPPLPPFFGGYVGAVITDDFRRLCAAVGRPFEFHVTPVYSGVTFWDNNHKFIGHFEGGGLGLSYGTGGGTGSWSHCAI